jgi:hypothetical protein
VVNAECEKPSNKVMLYSKKRVKKYKYHGFFVTIQDSVDELGSGRRSGGKSVVPGENHRPWASNL